MIPQPLIPDAAVATAIPLSLRAHARSAQDVVVTLAFGSLARGDSRVNSDFDLIHLVRPTIAPAAQVEFRRITVGPRQVDTNLIGIDALASCFEDPTWGYRFYFARPIVGTATRPFEEVTQWLGRLNAIIASPAAFRHRVVFNLRHLRALTTLLSRVDVTTCLQCYLLGEVLHLSPFLVLDLSERVPFATRRYPAEEALSIERESDSVSSFRELCGQLARVVVSSTPGGTWSLESAEAAQSLRRFCRRVIESEYPEALGKGYVFAVESSADRLARIEESLRAAAAPSCSVPIDADNAIHAFVRHCTDELAGWTTAHAEHHAIAVKDLTRSEEAASAVLTEDLLPWNALGTTDGESRYGTR
ncbi:MAG: hypothetical protein AMXMBFR58_29320 [Phycisphaerae bacterium]